MRAAVLALLLTGCTNGCLDITQTTRDVTVQWSLLRKSGDAAALSTTLIGFGAERVTVHHNLYAGPIGNPEVNGGTADVRNNLVWGWLVAGVGVRNGARANVVNNFFERGSNALSIETSEVHAAGNVAGDGSSITGTGAALLTAPQVTSSSACDAARAVLDGAGVRPLDPEDRAALANISLSGCGP